MSWSRHGPPPVRRGYHHGNLREALIRATLHLIAERGLSGFTFAEAARALSDELPQRLEPTPFVLKPTEPDSDTAD